MDEEKRDFRNKFKKPEPICYPLDSSENKPELKIYDILNRNFVYKGEDRETYYSLYGLLERHFYLTCLAEAGVFKDALTSKCDDSDRRIFSANRMVTILQDAEPEMCAEIGDKALRRDARKAISEVETYALHVTQNNLSANINRGTMLGGPGNNSRNN